MTSEEEEGLEVGSPRLKLLHLSDSLRTDKREYCSWKLYPCGKVRVKGFNINQENSSRIQSETNTPYGKSCVHKLSVLLVSMVYDFNVLVVLGAPQ